MYGFACSCIGMSIAAIGTSKSTFAYGCAATFGIFFFNFNVYVHINAMLVYILTNDNRGVGLQIPPWLYGVEITPLKLRYFAGAIAAASGMCCDLLKLNFG